MRENNYRVWIPEEKQMGSVGIFYLKWDNVDVIGGDSYDLKDVKIMQSTGLKDKNGVDVFEGDIVCCTKGCPHEVIWLQEYTGTFIGAMPAWYLSGLREGYAWTGTEEVIGNIYESPEKLN